MTKKPKIAVSNCSGVANYEQWLANGGADVFVLSAASKNVSDVSRADGLVLSGGGDIHPQRYGRPELLHRLDAKTIEEERDELEWRALELAFEKRIPVLGICRGMQLINVFLGGSLIHDIPEVLGSQIHGAVRDTGKKGVVRKKDQRHKVQIRRGSLLNRICSATTGEVNSSHHQAVDQLGEGLVCSAHAEPTVPEALEWESPDGRSWLCAVQWHPERMADQENPLSTGIRQAFLESIG